MLIKKYFLFK